MTVYYVDFTTTASLSVKVEADDAEAAIDAAYDELPGGVCAPCSGWGQAWVLDLGDWEVSNEPPSEVTK